MNEPRSYSHRRYLKAKKTVTNRALSQRVWETFTLALHQAQTDMVRILDVGGGVGSMALRVWKNTRQLNIDYTIVDQSKAALSGARDLFRSSGWTTKEDNDDLWTSRRSDSNIEVHLVQSDIFNFLQSGHSQSRERYFNVVIAESILDLIALKPFVIFIKPLLQKPKIIYNAENFNGLTTFLPRLMGELNDEKVFSLYHDSMYQETPQGRNEGPETGRALLQILRSFGAKIDAAASSDWIVMGQDGEYPADEAYFLHHILHFIERELTDHPDLDANQFREWITARRKQIHSGELIYMAHQLDILARFD